MTMKRTMTAGLIGMLLCVGTEGVSADVGGIRPAEKILDKTGVRGGLVVHVGCGDGRLTVGLRPNDRYVVHGLDTNAENVERARRHIRSTRQYGPVSVRQWDGQRLPYADNLANLVVVQCVLPNAAAEILRVLAPGGVAVVDADVAKDWLPAIRYATSPVGHGFVQFTKPYPSAIDQWTHYLHGPDNNAVAQDTRIAPPRSMQWKAGPMWCRSHEYNSSVAALVSADGRLFYIMDQGLRGIIQIYDKNKRFPPRWALVARDAFSGIKLWERPMADFSPEAWGNYGFRSNPLVVPRRLVAVEDRVYTTLCYRGPVSVLDAATGNAIAVWEQTADAHEIVVVDGVAVLRVREPSDAADSRGWEEIPEYVTAVDADDGKIIWKERCDNCLVPLTLAAAKGRVCYHTYDEIVCRDLKTGRQLWRAPSEERTQPRDPADGIFRKGNTGILVIYQDVVLFSAKEGLEAFDLDSGKKLWTGPVVQSVAPENCFVSTGLFGARGAVWPMVTPESIDRRGSKVHFKGYDPKTGEIKQEVAVASLLSRGHHVRCYPGKATERFLMLPKRGVEFLDLAGNDHMRHDWLRGVCAYGMLPANGMVYTPPHQCFCYPGVVLKGFNALTGDAPVVRRNDRPRHVRGPAYKSVVRREAAATNPSDWPTYRHDARRSGSSATEVPAGVKEMWRRDLGGKLTQPVVSGNRVFVVSKNTHTVYCLDAPTGEALWTYTANGRVDSSPTVYRGRLLFGCTDGWVVCLRATDGQLAWKFRAAPAERQIVGFEQVESTWPVHGSVLVQDDVAYVTAGRSSYLDGGIYTYGLNPATGEVLYENRIADDRPDVTKDPGRPFDMDGALSDVLVSDGTDLYMYQVRLGPDLTRRPAPRNTSLGARPMGLHLMSTKGFLDDTWYDRTYWSYSRTWPGFYFSNLGPKSGQILVFDEKSTYGVKVFLKHEGPWYAGGHSPFFIPEEMDYELFADANTNEPVLDQPDREKGPGYSRNNPALWTKNIPVRVVAMVLAGDRLFAAGPPNVVDADDPFAAFEGRLGSKLCVFSTADGSKLAEAKLDSVPVFDGMAAAGGRLYMATTDGGLVCLGL